jgi:hypothetical protein
MALYHRVEQILAALRPVFRRQATFEWFVLLLWGVLERKSTTRHHQLSMMPLDWVKGTIIKRYTGFIQGPGRCQSFAIVGVNGWQHTPRCGT